MRLFLTALISFGLGLYVGKPSAIVAPVVDVEEVKCPVQVTPSVEKSAVVTPTPTPLVSTSPSPSPSPTKDPDEREDNKTKTETAPTAEEQADWVKEVIKDSATWLGRYKQGGTEKITITEEHFSALEQLKAALQKGNFSIVDEGEMHLGNYVYFLEVKAND